NPLAAHNDATHLVFDEHAFQCFERSKDGIAVEQPSLLPRIVVDKAKRQRLVRGVPQNLAKRQGACGSGAVNDDALADRALALKPVRQHAKRRSRTIYEQQQEHAVNGEEAEIHGWVDDERRDDVAKRDRKSYGETRPDEI